MPVIFLDRLPLPSLHAYTGISVALLSFSIYYAMTVTNTMDWRSDLNSSTKATHDIVDQVPEPLTFTTVTDTRTYFEYVKDVVEYMFVEPKCIWILINMAYCCLILIGKVIQNIVFGELRVSEQQHIKDKFWNFVFYKFIFIFGVINVQFMNEMVMWCAWFSVLGFLHLLAQLSKDRFDYLAFSPTTPKLTHVKLMALLLSLLSLSSLLFGVCILVGINAGFNTFAFMVAECILLSVKTVYIIVRYVIHLWDMNHDGVWENRGTYAYFAELIFELLALSIDFVHHLHMLVWSKILLSMASLVIIMQLRHLFYEMQRRIKKHKNYLLVVKCMEDNYPMATSQEIDSNTDDCAICWDKMETARRLPCGHLFHNSCLRSWLEQDTSCPTCRSVLSNSNSSHAVGASNDIPGNTGDNRLVTGIRAALAVGGGGTDGGEASRVERENERTTNHFFHFDGSRYVSWFPSFSVEVTHTSHVMRQNVPAATSQLDNMARQVHDLFPHMPLRIIIDDLRASRSMEITIENILDGRLTAPLHDFHMRARRTDSTNSAGAESSEPSSLDGVSASPAMAISDIASLDDLKQFFESDADAKDGEPQMTLGSRFSKSPAEREKMLKKRKEQLLLQARRRYMSKSTTSEAESDSSLTEGGNNEMVGDMRTHPV